MSGSSAGALVLLFLALYALLLFVVARRADRKDAPAEGDARRAVIYGLSLALLSSWTYFGAVGAASRAGLGFLPIFLGPFLAITLFFPLVRRIALVVKRGNIATIADFIASRYGKSRVLGPLVTVVAIVGAIPYIAAQLQPLAMGWEIITGSRVRLAIALPAIAALLAGFAILFGPRHALITEHRRGLVRAIALGTVIKFMGIAAAAMLGGVLILSDPRPGFAAANLGPLAHMPHFHITFLTATILAFAGFLCPPRRFYIAFVELEHGRDLRIGRWVLLGCLAIALIAVPAVLAAAGPELRARFPNPDMFVLAEAQYWGSPVLTAFIFLGGFSAAAAVVIAETVALSAMISNEFLLPLVHTRWKARARTNLAADIVGVRRAGIVILIGLACLYYWAMDHSQTLAKLGLVGAAAIAQLLPALVGAVTWRRGHARGAIWGIATGFTLWLVAVAMPQLVPDKQQLAWLFPFLSGSTIRWEDLDLPVMLSLSLNILLYVGISLRSRPSCLDIAQADAFVGGAVPEAPQRGLSGTVGELKGLIGQIIGRESALHLFGQFAGGRRQLHDSDPIDDDLANTAERILVGALGSALARRVIDSQFAPQPSEAVAQVLGEAALAVRFNRELLQATLDNLSQGVSVVDEDLRQVAWNAAFVDMFRIPPGFLYAGKPVADIVAFTARGLGQPEEDVPAYVERRLEQIRRRHYRAYERRLADGRYLRVVSSPMPGGRYVTSFTDVTELRVAAVALHAANEQLEERVAARTQELTEANLAAGAARLRAEYIAKEQARFLAAASHDLLQPLQAARLFIGSYLESRPGGDPEAILANADMALDSADRLLRALLNLSRLEFGAAKPEMRAVELDPLLRDLCRGFAFDAREKGLTLRVVPTRAWVLSDRDLLRSVLQNLVSNAIRYTRTGAVLVGCRNDGAGLRLEVRDSGPGIPPESQEAIFGEFSRLSRDRNFGPGTGLGLSIAKRICALLGHSISVRSRPGEGSIFSVLLPRGHADRGEAPGEGPARLPEGLRVLCVENDPAVLGSMETLLRKWKVEVSTAQSCLGALSLRGEWDVILADYRLETDYTGLDLIAAMQDRASAFALLTADQSVEMVERAAILNVEIIRKPVAPLFLRGFLMRAHSLASMGAARRARAAAHNGSLDAV